MSLFPAYSQEAAVASPREAESDVIRWAGSPREADVAMEDSLLASSDSEVEPTPAPAPRTEPELDYYVDRSFDGGNLRVSTIYYPGRPQYNSAEFHHALGLVRGAGLRRKKRARRYWEVVSRGGGEGPHGEGEGEGERGAALRRALVERPQDEELWLQYIDYQEWVHGGEAGLAAAAAAAARAPRAAGLRARRHALAQRTLSAQDHLARLRDELAQEKDLEVSAELWVRLLGALALAPAAGARGAQAAAAAALRACRRLPAAYPNLLYAYGSILRAAGLWETLVLLLELVLAATSPAAFPPPRDDKAEQEAEERLQDYEDKVVSSGLPGGAVWARVERARGAAHWRPARAAAADADPQRAPAVSDVADLVLPATDPHAAFLLLVNALRLAKVPLLPAAQYVYEAAGAGADEWDCGEALLSAVRAARRLPAAHPAHTAPAAARDLVRLALDPPHYFSLDYGFRNWVSALWEAALAAGGAEPAAALLCWRMRWLHAQLLLLPESQESASEARWIRDAAQATLKRWGGSHALAFAQFARIAHAAARRGGGGKHDAGLRAATVALRAALQDDSVPIHYLLYIARIVNEVSEGPVGALSEQGACALACAVLRRPLPADLAPDAGLLRDARDEVSEGPVGALSEQGACALACAVLRRPLPADLAPDAGLLRDARDEVSEGPVGALSEQGACALACAVLRRPLPADLAPDAGLLRDARDEVSEGPVGALSEQGACALACAVLRRPLPADLAPDAGLLRDARDEVSEGPVGALSEQGACALACAVLRRPLPADLAPDAGLLRDARDEVSEGPVGALSEQGACALACAVLRRPLPADLAPDAGLLRDARDEVSEGPVGALSEQGACALACAVLRRPLPADLAPDAGLLRDARDECCRRCQELEQEMEAEEDKPLCGLGCGARLLRAMLPCEAEWGVARALLSAPRQRHEQLQTLLASSTGVGRVSRWREQQAAALVLRVRNGTAAARELSRRYPNNALLALVSSGAAAWRSGGVADVASSPARQLGAAWPALLAGLAGAGPGAGAGAGPGAAGRLARRLRRAGPPAAALAWALRLEAEARAPAPRLEHVAHAAMDALPHHKWLTVRSAALGAAGGGGALPDVLLERALRLHALPDELRALAPDRGERAPNRDNL